MRAAQEVRPGAVFDLQGGTAADVVPGMRRIGKFEPQVSLAEGVPLTSGCNLQVTNENGEGSTEITFGTGSITGFLKHAPTETTFPESDLAQQQMPLL